MLFGLVRRASEREAGQRRVVRAARSEHAPNQFKVVHAPFTKGGGAMLSDPLFQFSARQEMAGGFADRYVWSEQPLLHMVTERDGFRRQFRHQPMQRRRVPVQGDPQHAMVEMAKSFGMQFERLTAVACVGESGFQGGDFIGRNVAKEAHREMQGPRLRGLEAIRCLQAGKNFAMAVFTSSATGTATKRRHRSAFTRVPAG